MAPTTESARKSKEERDLARRRQIEAMEAHAKGTIYRRDTPPEPLEPPKEVEKPRRKSEPPPKVEKKAFPFALSGSAAENTEGGMASIFDKKPNYDVVDQTINLNDHQKGEYEKENSKTRNSFIDIFFGGTGNTRGGSKAGSEHHRPAKQASVTTTWQRSITGRLVVFIFLFVLVGLVAFSYPLFSVILEDSEPIAEVEEIHLSRFETLESFIRSSRVTKKEDISNEQSASYYALKWISDTDPAQLEKNDTGLLERYAMAVFFYSCHPDDAEAHSNGEIDDYESSWINHENWMSEKSVCDWHGIDCVISSVDHQEPFRLNLTSNNVTGTIPDEIRALTHLRLLDLSYNNMQGTIPERLTRIFMLKHLFLNSNSLTGSIPDGIGQMESARDINLSDNELEGKIPASLDKLYHLKHMILDHNSLTGSIPSLKDLHHIESLHFEHNNLIGELPLTLFYLTTLVHLDISENEITGTIPPEVNSMKSLEVLYMGNNLLEGNVPVPFGRMHHLIELELQGNRLDGELPVGMGTLTLLERLLIASNSLSGPLPPEWGGMTGLKELSLEKNQLTGGLPPEIGNLESLESIHIHDNKITGEVPDEVCALKTNSSLKIISTDCTDDVVCACCTMCY